MSTLQEFLQKTKTRGLIWWLKYYWNNILETIYEKKTSNVDDSWKDKIKTKEPIVPQGWTRDNAFLHLNKEFQGTTMKRYKDGK